MSLFFRLLGEGEKGAALAKAVRSVAAGKPDARVFEVAPQSFSQVPGAPFAYWVSETCRALFLSLSALETGNRIARRGVNTNDDSRFLRLCWEVSGLPWHLHVKGGEFSPYYADPHVSLNWRKDGDELEAERVTARVYRFAIVPSRESYFRPGLTWPRRSQKGLAFRAMPAGCIFGDKGPAALARLPRFDPHTGDFRVGGRT